MIISIYDCESRSIYKLENYFLCFIEMHEGSIQINKEVYYRSSTLLFLTLDENNKVKLNVMKLPAYVECNKRLNEKPRIFKLQSIKYEYSIDFSKLCKEKVIKAFIGRIEVQGRPDILVAVLQYQSQIVIEAFNSSQFNESLPTGGSLIPMLQNCVQIQNTKSINVFVHTIDQAHRTQKINLLTITSGEYYFELPKMVGILDIKQQSLISIQKFEDSILTLDEAFFVRRYKFSKRLNELRMYQESELIDTAQITTIQTHSQQQHFQFTNSYPIIHY